jgi:gas vesicle protein GvpG
MGLLTGLLTLPLAPVRGTAWLAERIQEHAESELYGDGEIHERLAELQRRHARGELDDSELVDAEDELLEQLVTLPDLEPTDGDG